MCIISVKYLKNRGWVGIKNRDRAYQPVVHIKKSFRGGNERLLLWDDGTKWTEGVNEFGIAVLSSAAGGPKDMKKDEKIPSDLEQKHSRDGRKIRKALHEKTLDKVVKVLLDEGIVGNTAVFSESECVLIEAVKVQLDKPEYKSETRSFGKNEILVRTNHGLLIPTMGYQVGMARRSSELRRDIVLKNLEKASSPKSMLDSMSITNKEEPQYGPLRNDKRKALEDGSIPLRTTGQLLIIPKERSLHYKPIMSKVEFDLNKLNSEDHKTKFEVISKNNLIELRNIPTFMEYIYS